MDDFKVYVVYFNGKPLSRDIGRKVVYLDTKGAKQTATVLSKYYAEREYVNKNGYDKWHDELTKEERNKIINKYKKEHFEVREFEWNGKTV